MASRKTNNPSLPDKLLIELEMAARTEDRSVGDVLWQRLQSGRERAKDLGLTEDDIPQLIAESRREQRKER
jgi:hypothetical protein